MNDEFDRESARPQPRKSAARPDDDDIREGDPPARSRDRGYDDDDDDMDDLRRPRVARSGPNVMAPAICLLLAACLGLLMGMLNCVLAVVQDPPPPDPNLPPMFQDMAKNTHGPVAAGIQGIFALMNAFIILGSIQMLRMKTWGLGLTASILSMVNLGSCCCLLGLPFGIWALISLLKPEVKDAFS